MAGHRRRQHRPRGAPDISKRRRPVEQYRGRTLHELDTFTDADLARWDYASQSLDQLARELHHELEIQRRARRAALLEALRRHPAGEYDIEGWCRIVAFQYSHEPLSAKGSFRNHGGRFNVGYGLAQEANLVPWSALYLASDQATAYRERFGIRQDESVDGLSAEDLAIRGRGNFVTLEIAGHFDNLYNVGNPEALAAVASILAKFKKPKSIGILEKRLGIAQSHLIRNHTELRRWLVEENWRTLPIQFDLPSHPQIFAELVKSAGYEGIIYPSFQTG